MSTWDALDRELDAWRASAQRATLWWRDDDACRDSPELRRLLTIAQDHAAPVALAVIPAALDASLVAAVASCPAVAVVQHGYGHRNHAPPPERSCELGPHRSVTTCMAELADGRERLVHAFGDRFWPVLVPPWNRIDPGIVAVLPQAGLHAVSTFGPRSSSMPATGVFQCNTHVDLIAWRAGRAFIGTDRALARLVEHLAARRQRRVDDAEVSGILTHHLDFTSEAWDFVAELLAHTARHPAARWLGAPDVFAQVRIPTLPLTSARSA